MSRKYIRLANIVHLYTNVLYSKTQLYNHAEENTNKLVVLFNIFKFLIVTVAHVQEFNSWHSFIEKF